MPVATPQRSAAVVGCCVVGQPRPGQVAMEDVAARHADLGLDVEWRHHLDAGSAAASRARQRSSGSASTACRERSAASFARSASPPDQR